MSLQGGYTSWLLARFRQMEEQDAAVDKAKEVERSIHKNSGKISGRSLRKRLRSMNW